MRGVIIDYRNHQIPPALLSHKKWMVPGLLQVYLLSFPLLTETIFCPEMGIWPCKKFWNISYLGVVQQGGECWILELTDTLLSNFLDLNWTANVWGITQTFSQMDAYMSCGWHILDAHFSNSCLKPYYTWWLKWTYWTSLTLLWSPLGGFICMTSTSLHFCHTLYLTSLHPCISIIIL